jgi:hypothetical protein
LAAGRIRCVDCQALREKAQSLLPEMSMDAAWKGLKKTLRIIGKRYRLLVVEKVDEEDSYGEHSYAKQEIRLRDEQSFEPARDTLLHEALHGVDEQMSIGLSEKQVRMLGSGVLALMRDNPWFVRWLMEDEPETTVEGEQQ